MSYTPLHCHSTYSLLDGLSQPSQMAERCLEIGSTSCALTDHGNLSGAIDFYESLTKNKIKPILGCELYILPQGRRAEDKNADNKKLHHQVVIAKNLAGWKELLKLVSTSNRPEYKYYNPRLDWEIIQDVNPKNLISFSGHPGSTLAYLLQELNWKALGTIFINKMKKVFGEEHFFLEVQLISKFLSANTEILADKIRTLSEITNTKCIATPDAHYCKREEAIDQHVLLSASLNLSIPKIYELINRGEEVSLSGFFKCNDFHIPTYAEMITYGNTKEELDNTNLISDMCEPYDLLSPPKLPSYKCPPGYNANSLLRHLCADGWKEKMSHIAKDSVQFQEYGERVKEELDIFTKYNLSSYFLMVKDVLDFCHSKKYLVGPGRGSVGGCMTAYLLGITEIDSIQHKLLLSRFFNSGRLAEGHISLPDIDIDVPKKARAEVIERLRSIYGKDNVAQIVTFQTLQGRAALKRVMSARGNISFVEQNLVTKNIPDKAKVADELQQMQTERGFSSLILWCLENLEEKFKDICYIENDKLCGPYKEIFEQAIRLENTKIIASTHAAGIVVSTEPISNFCPMMIDKDGDYLMAAWEGPSCEKAGLVKLDILGINMLDKIMGIEELLKGNVCYEL